MGQEHKICHALVLEVSYVLLVLRSDRYALGVF